MAVTMQTVNRRRLTNAKPTPVYGMRPSGYGVRGWRVHCPDCGYLSQMYENYMSPKRRASEHRC